LLKVVPSNKNQIDFAKVIERDKSNFNYYDTVAMRQAILCLFVLFFFHVSVTSGLECNCQMPISEKIVGGKNATVPFVPWLVNLGINSTLDSKDLQQWINEFKSNNTFLIKAD
jgi:hypothetical protein